jgi:hypothetical protein
MCRPNGFARQAQHARRPGKTAGSRGSRGGEPPKMKADQAGVVCRQPPGLRAPGCAAQAPPSRHDGASREATWSTRIRSKKPATSLTRSWPVPAGWFRTARKSTSTLDMSISWAGDLTINHAEGVATTISSAPKTGTNADLKTVGVTYKVFKYVGGNADKPHWSDNGH